MRVTVTIDSAAPDAIRAAVAQCSRERDHFPTYANWEPRVWCDGNGIGNMRTDPTNAAAAARIIAAAYAQDGADDPTADGNAAPVYVALRPTSASMTRQALFLALRTIEQRATFAHTADHPADVLAAVGAIARDAIDMVANLPE